MRSTSVPEGPGSVSGAPDLPAGFTDMFTSQSSTLDYGSMGPFGIAP